MAPRTLTAKGEAVGSGASENVYNRAHKDSSPTWPVCIGSVWPRDTLLLYWETVEVLCILHMYPSLCILALCFMFSNPRIIYIIVCLNVEISGFNWIPLSQADLCCFVRKLWCILISILLFGGICALIVSFANTMSII